VQRVRARLTVEPTTAECWVLLEGGLIICAGSAASSVRRAVDGLIARLRRRLDVLAGSDAIQRIEILPATATSSVALTTTEAPE